MAQTEEFEAGAEVDQKILFLPGDSYEVTFPNKVFLIIVARLDVADSQVANYDFSFSFTDIDGESIAAEEKRIAEQKAAEAAAQAAAQEAEL